MRDRDLSVRVASLPVTFVLPGETEIDRLRHVDPDRDLQYFRRGERSWVLQTYLRLRAAGFVVDLADTPPDRGLVVFHAKHRRAIARSSQSRHDLILVAIRADNSSPLIADFEVLQNGRFADGDRRFALPFWPQPGIRRRDPSRESRIERVGYMGLVENLHPDFRSEVWQRALAELGLEWVPRTARFHGMGDPAQIDWEDYRDLDVVLAIRPRQRRLDFAKPANKLVNAWRAEVPALVGDEYAFREVRRSDLDYLEANNAGEAISALRRLQTEPDLHARMVGNGRRRAAEFSFEAIVDQWSELLFRILPSRVAAGDLPWARRLPIPARIAVLRAFRVLTLERAR